MLNTTARGTYADSIEELGHDINAIRLKLIDDGAFFTAGVLRAAEEALLVAMVSLRDRQIPDGEL